MKDFIKNIIKEQIKSKDVLIKYNDLIKKYEVREIKVFNCVKEKIEKEKDKEICLELIKDLNCNKL